MALLRMTDKKLAANRANAKKSKGPVTPAGKEKVSANACKHHLFARKFKLHPAWEARIRDRALPLLADVEDPAEHAALLHYLVFNFWILELNGYYARVLDAHIRLQHGSEARGVHHFCTTQTSLFLAIHTRLHQLRRDADRAEKAWKLAKANTARERAVPQIVENELLTPAPKKLTLAAAAPSASSPSWSRCTRRPKTATPTRRPASLNIHRHALPRNRGSPRAGALPSNMRSPIRKGQIYARADENSRQGAARCHAAA